MLGATQQHHFNQQSQAYDETIESLEGNTYVDNLMKTGSDIREISRFREEAIEILESKKFPVHKWESDIQKWDCPNCHGGEAYTRLIKDVKKTFHNTMGRTSFKYEQVESVAMDIEQHLNNCPLA